MDWFLIAWAFLGCLYWLWMAIGMARVAAAVPTLIDLVPREPPDGWPYVSIIVPACNEGETIRAAAQTVLTQDYERFEAVLLDDRSTDATGCIIDELAADPRVVSLHITELPDGWLGKVHALNCGAAEARGDWLLLTDADVHLKPDALRRAVAYAEEHGLDHLAVAPEMWPGSWAVNAAVALFLRSFCVGMRCWAVPDSRSRAAIGVGAFNLVRRDALEQTAGFEGLRLETADDVGLGMMIKQAGFRSALVNGVGLVGLHWYHNVGEMARGAEKGFIPVCGGSLLRTAVIVVVSLLTELAPLTILCAPLNRGLLWPGLAMWSAVIVSAAIGARWARRSIWPALLFPVGAVINVALLLRASWLGWRRGGIRWRTTFYPTALLLSGSRVRFP